VIVLEIERDTVTFLWMSGENGFSDYLVPTLTVSRLLDKI